MIKKIVQQIHIWTGREKETIVRLDIAIWWRIKTFAP